MGGHRVSVKHTRRGLSLKSRKPADSLKAKFSNGALRAGHGLRPNAKLRFEVRLRDASGKTTRLSVRAR